MYYRRQTLQRPVISRHLISTVIFITACFSTLGAQAEPVADRGSGNTNTRVSRTNNQFDIDGGQRAGSNLFHSFEQFGLSAGEIANFLSTPQIRNILARVSGGDASVINGLIQVTGGNSNLYLMNPAGIVFGSNASLNVPASFVATTATGIEFENGWFSARASNSYADLISEPVGFAFSVSQPGAIVNGATLNAPEAIALIGGTVINTGRLSAPTITLTAVPKEGVVRLSQTGNILSLDIQPFTDSQPNRWSLPILALPQLLTGGDLQSATGITVTELGGVALTSSQREIPSQPGSVFVSGTLNASRRATEQPGGVVQMSGTSMTIMNATIAATSGQDGGSVFLNNYFYPGNFSLSALLLQNSTIDVDSRIAGNGGQVAIAAEGGVDLANSTISARGGVVSGNGGSIRFDTPFLQVTAVDALTPQAILLTRLNVSAVNGTPGSIDYGKAGFGLLPDINLTPPNIDQDPFVTLNPLPADGSGTDGYSNSGNPDPIVDPNINTPTAPENPSPIPSEQPSPNRPSVNPLVPTELSTSFVRDLNTIQLAKPTVICPTATEQLACSEQQDGAATSEPILKSP
jgi:filamentous hemagglutinin family protein